MIFERFHKKYQGAKEKSQVNLYINTYYNNVQIVLQVIGQCPFDNFFLCHAIEAIMLLALFWRSVFNRIAVT